MDRAPDSIGPTVDVALLADAVQAVRELFVLGGGWDTLWVRSFPARHPSMAIGLRLRVPTSWRADVLDLSVELQDADGAPLLSKPLSHQVRLPPQPQCTLSHRFRCRSIVHLQQPALRERGSYSFVISVDGDLVSSPIQRAGQTHGVGPA